MHHAPVLVAVEPHSMAWLAGHRGPDRPGATWCPLLQAWPSLARVVSDAGTGLARGVKLLHDARGRRKGPGAASERTRPPWLRGVPYRTGDATHGAPALGRRGHTGGDGLAGG